MNCFIGGSGSTGSSLLANVLNRHSQIFCGPETYLFSKHQLYENWTIHKNSIIEGKLRSFPWHRYSQVDLLHKAFNWEIRALKELVSYSNFIAEFSEEFFTHTLRHYRKEIWIEKTPSNVYGFSHLPEAFPNCYLIHTVRNPYDTIASLNKRGFSVYYSVCLYLLNTSVGLAMNNYEHYLEVVYEDLVTDPPAYLKRLCNNLGIPFENQMLEKAEHAFEADIPTWKQSEHREITDSSIGGFADLSKFVQDEIISTINALQISPSYQQKFKLEFTDIPSICSHYGFQHYEDDGFHNIFQLQIDKTRDHIMRILKNYPSRFRDYPIVLK